MKKEELKIVIKDGEPCKHPSCLNHRTHPCENCGRIGGQGNIYENLFLVDKKL